MIFLNSCFVMFLLLKCYFVFGPLPVHKCQVEDTNLDCFNDLLNIRQDDPILVQVVRNNYLYPPPKQDDSSILQMGSPSDRVARVREVIFSLSPGFFIECGALDGSLASNTLWLERKLGWRGLLIEANQNDFAKLTKFGRPAWTSNLCLSSIPRPNKVNFYMASSWGGLPGVAGLIKREQYNTNPVEVQCVPLYTLLLALNQTQIDFFSIDIEGTELDMLKTIPFDKVLFKVLLIENAFIPGGHKALEEFLITKSFIFYRFAPDDDVHPWDSIFLHSTLPFAKTLLHQRANAQNNSRIV